MLRKTYRLMQKTRTVLAETSEQVLQIAETRLPQMIPGHTPHPRGFVCCPPDVWQGNPSRGHDLMGFALKTTGTDMRRLMSPAGLRDLDPSFHGFDWLHDLRTVGSNDARAAARMILNAWVEMSPYAHAVIGAPILTTRRLMRTIGGYGFYAPVMTAEEREALFGTMIEQTRDLKRVLKNTPAPLDGFFAAAGITAVTVATGGLDIDTHVKTLHRLVDKLVLNDGGPSTRRPDDLPDMLKTLIDLRHIIEHARLPLPAFIAHAIDRLVPALQFFRMGDGGLAAFHGGTCGNDIAVHEILHHTRLKTGVPETLATTGFERMQAGAMVAIIDAGRAGPGHHASTSAFELSIGAERVFVGCGQHAFDANWQDLLAATSAHSTCTLDHQDNILDGANYDVDITRQDSDAGATVQVTHTGYVTRNGYTHARDMFMHADGACFEGTDTVVASIPPMNPINMTVRFHLHPDVAVTQDAGNNNVLVLTLADQSVWTFGCDSGALGIEDSVYLAATGRPQKTKQIVISAPVHGANKAIQWGLQRAE